VRIRPVELAKIRSGDVDLAFRRWERPRVLAGTKLRTAIGLVEVTSVKQVSAISERDARRSGAASKDELLTALAPKLPLPIWRIGVRYAGEDPRIALRNDAALDAATRAELIARLERLDRAARGGPWTLEVLTLIAANPARRAPDLAASLGRETLPFKRDVRKLKELGLTESLDVGYRLSPRGKAVLRAFR
jgi:hypothetical protein